jgi:hypothetical protein
MIWKKELITEKLCPIDDPLMGKLRAQWFEGQQKEVSYKQFVPQAVEWFRGTCVNDIQGWDAFPMVDVTMGNTHYIESFLLKYGWHGFQILKNEYAHQVEWMTTFKTNQQLISDKVQFVLTKVEGREADLMKSMGLDPSRLSDPSRNVVKYYIKFLVRDELYIGPTWDADPDWKKSLRNFLTNLNK